VVSIKRQQYLDDYVDSRKRISISLSESDFNKLSYIAKLNHSKPTSYVSNLVQHELIKTPFIPKVLTDDIKDIKSILRDIATNIQQLTHRSSTLKMLVDDRELLIELQKLEEGITTHIHKSISR